MLNKEIPREYRQQIEKAVNYILKNLNDDLSLETLAGIANYSPYHFQKLFKQLIGESPKQYIIKMRLETAAHYLIIDPYKSITEIAIDCGFSSPAVFSRAFKNYFGVSAELMRSMPYDERLMICKSAYHYERLVKCTKKTGKNESNRTLAIEVKRMPSLSGICVNTTFEGVYQIQQSLKEVVKLACSYDLFSHHSKIIGIMYPHHNIYRAFVSIDPSVSVPLKLSKVELKSGKYATFKLEGCTQDAMDMASTSFYKFWLPENGYKMADTYVFEIFSENPASKPYQEIEREICVPVEPT